MECLREYKVSRSKDSFITIWMKYFYHRILYCTYKRELT
jgi:hypothetical protein